PQDDPGPGRAEVRLALVVLHFKAGSLADDMSRQPADAGPYHDDSHDIVSSVDRWPTAALGGRRSSATGPTQGWSTGLPSPRTAPCTSCHSSRTARLTKRQETPTATIATPAKSAQYRPGTTPARNPSKPALTRNNTSPALVVVAQTASKRRSGPWRSRISETMVNKAPWTEATTRTQSVPAAATRANWEARFTSGYSARLTSQLNVKPASTEVNVVSCADAWRSIARAEDPGAMSASPNAPGLAHPTSPLRRRAEADLA